jgi:NAD(P)-dependent dehydrogenase (short-subunit alcohol dehydrogenase family)
MEKTMAAKTVLITGASGGIGKAAAELFQQKGWNVVATMRSPEAGTELAAMDKVLVTKLDVTDEASIAAAVNFAKAKFGAIDVLINNAGYGEYGVLEATPVESMRRQFETNVIGVLAATKAVLPGMRKQKSGVIVNVSSIIGRVSFPLSALYCSSKFAVEGLSEALSFELREIGVRIKVIEPGIIYTNFSNAMSFSNDESLAEYQRLIGRFGAAFETFRANGAPASVAAEVIYAAATDESDQLRYTAGEDARQFKAERESMDDAAYFARMRAMFGQ